MSQESVIWEAPKVEKPIFKLYYDHKGNVITYTCEVLEGNYIEIDALTFAEARYDVKVIDGKISKVSDNAIISKLVPNSKGIGCTKDDISIIIDENYTLGDGIKYAGKVTYWSLKNNVLTI